MATGFFLAPFLIRHLGIAGYGLVPLTTSIVTYLSVANIALNSAVGRHISVAITEGDRERASVVFNTSLWASIGICCAVVLVGGALSSAAPAIINVPAGFEGDARGLFLTGSANVALVLLSSPLSVALYYSNRLDKKGTIELSNRLVYVALVVLLLSLLSPRPVWVGVALLASGALGLVQTASWWRRTMPWLRVQWQFSREILKEMLWFGGWSLAAYTGNLVFLTIDLIVVNRFLGPTPGGIYAALLQWPGLVRSFGATVAVVFTQPMAHVYAKDGPEALFRYGLRSMRYMAALVVLPTVAVAGSAAPLLKLWLGPSMSEHWPLLVLLVFHLAHNLAGLPLISVLQTVLKVRSIGIATCVAGLLDVVLAVILVNESSWGMYAVATSGAIVASSLAALLLPALAALEFRRPLREPLTIIAKTAAMAVSGCALGTLASRYYGVIGWWGLAAHVAALSLLTAVASLFVFVQPEERATLVGIVRRQAANLVSAWHS
jgi:membrane protein EpsK